MRQSYRLQYFLYALGNRLFGSTVKYKRDSLHRVYEVNRHGFNITSSGRPLGDIVKGYIDAMVSGGWEIISGSFVDLYKSDVHTHIRMMYEGETFIEYVSFELSKDMTNQRTLYVFQQVYKRNKK